VDKLNDWGIDWNADPHRIIGWGCPLHGPIMSISSTFGGEMLGYINYFLPIAEMAAITATWVVSIGAYYAISIVLRWAKAIS
jgi:hypothetical protein